MPQIQSTLAISWRRAPILWLALIWLLLSQIVCDTAQQQARQNQPPVRRQLIKKYKRPANLARPNSRISCPVCAADFMSKPVAVEDPCFNPRFNLVTAELEIITDCPLATRNCTTETVYVNGVLTSIKRKCGQPNGGSSGTCSDTCVVAGLGLTTRTCSICCPPFDYDTYNTDASKPRECA